MEQVKCKRGDSFEIQLTIVDSSGNPVDLSAYSARYALKKRQSESSADYLVAPDDVYLDISNGVITGTVTPDLTTEIPSGQYIEEIEIYTADVQFLKKFERIRIVEPRIISELPEISGGGGGGELPY